MNNLQQISTSNTLSAEEWSAPTHTLFQQLQDDSAKRSKNYKGKKKIPLRGLIFAEVKKMYMPSKLNMILKLHASHPLMNKSGLLNQVSRPCIRSRQNQFDRGFALRMWPILFTRSFLVQTGNILMLVSPLSLHRTYGKLSWSREVNRTTSLNHRHVKRLVIGVCFLTIIDASDKAAST